MPSVNRYARGGMDVMSRFPVSSARCRGRPIIADPLYQQPETAGGGRGLNGRVKNITPSFSACTLLFKAALAIVA